MRRQLLLGLAALAFAATTANAQNYPDKPIRVIIPFGAGSATDLIPRIVLEQVSKQIGQPIVVENRGGAGGTIGATQVARADPDGYTLLATSSAHTIAPALHSLLYDAAGDFAGVGLMGSSPSVMIISPDKGFKKVQDFVAAAKAKPEAFSFATVGVGSAVHLSAERFRYSAGYKALHIPFKGGSEAITEVIAGRVDYYFCPISTALPFIREGKLLGLVVSSPKRSSVLPDVPTTLELGYADSDYTSWIGLLAPAKTPRPIIDRLAKEIAEAVKSPAVQERFKQLGVEPLPMSPQEIDARLKDEVVRFTEFAKKTGMKTN
ncbi:tripartite tricarboxylate transporter family receptor [Variibacter gotjawalensis]|uniref:Tripartite tricarboxylate transporter family receptor n=1 Tax=Variibacter gotjawalensis TaxID=1333996 RepID=A0A0S3PWR4_9BRAD|nr:tripartite tricarboxylate transporter substrate binding protein [Variibacter gotjawalensis]NIK46166.1 tripartite-type tricarboxylate transporter receptor subunit TctC [Variibacter gotjawalensis]RZS48083.1 tripartite-type tricarboxylate transporter receptor subunit TctC [Variibacter gotjawalensis]BAT60340.1 tripartite tricarboxylate transporter family receptor [Variibacter gotjawalensis]